MAFAAWSEAGQLGGGFNPLAAEFVPGRAWGDVDKKTESMKGAGQLPHLKAMKQPFPAGGIGAGGAGGDALPESLAAIWSNPRLAADVLAAAATLHGGGGLDGNFGGKESETPSLPPGLQAKPRNDEEEVWRVECDEEPPMMAPVLPDDEVAKIQVRQEDAPEDMSTPLEWSKSVSMDSVLSWISAAAAAAANAAGGVEERQTFAPPPGLGDGEEVDEVTAAAAAAVAAAAAAVVGGSFDSTAETTNMPMSFKPLNGDSANAAAGAGNYGDASMCRWHRSANSVGVISEDGHVFTKTSSGRQKLCMGSRGRPIELAPLCMVFDESLRCGGTHQFNYRILDGELGAADGAGFVFDSKVRRNNIQRMRSVFLNQRGCVCVRDHERVKKLGVRLPPLGAGMSLGLFIDLDTLYLQFMVFAADGQPLGMAEVSVGSFFASGSGSPGNVGSGATGAGVSRAPGAVGCAQSCATQARGADSHDWQPPGSGFFCAVVTKEVSVGLV